MIGTVRRVQAEGSFLDPAVLAAAFSEDGPLLARHRPNGDPIVGPWVASLDLGVVHDLTAFAMGRREGDRVVLDRMMSWQGSHKRPVDFSEVEAFILEMHARFGFVLHFDSWQGLDLAQRLRARGVKAVEYPFSPASKQKLAASLISTINSGNLRLYEADGLRDELMRLRLVQTSSGSWAFDHRRGGHDDRCVTLALMTVALLEMPAVDHTNFATSRDGFFSDTPGRSKWGGIMGDGGIDRW